jgi:predicted nuclease of predicted toxin-antitoxin system
MNAFLIDEVFPPGAAVLLREKYGHDAVHVADVGLRGADDPQVAAAARAAGRAIVTENVADFVAERDVVLVFVLKKNLPTGSVQASALAATLDRWAQEHPEPYLGPHWPRVLASG